MQNTNPSQIEKLMREVLTPEKSNYRGRCHSKALADEQQSLQGHQRFEAVELRERQRYKGKGVRQAVANVNNEMGMKF